MPRLTPTPEQWNFIHSLGPVPGAGLPVKPVYAPAPAVGPGAGLKPVAVAAHPVAHAYAKPAPAARARNAAPKSPAPAYRPSPANWFRQVFRNAFAIFACAFVAIALLAAFAHPLELSTATLEDANPVATPADVGQATATVVTVTPKGVDAAAPLTDVRIATTPDTAATSWSFPPTVVVPTVTPGPASISNPAIPHIIGPVALPAVAVGPVSAIGYGAVEPAIAIPAYHTGSATVGHKPAQRAKLNLHRQDRPAPAAESRPIAPTAGVRAALPAAADILVGGVAPVGAVIPVTAGPVGQPRPVNQAALPHEDTGYPTTTLLWLCSSAVLFMGTLQVLGRRNMEKTIKLKIQEIEAALRKNYAELDAPGPVVQPAPVADPWPQRTSEPEPSCLPSLPPPARYLGALAAECARRHPRVELKRFDPDRPWRFGLDSVKGNVKLDNQDYALAFQLGEHTDVLIVADGMGGADYGQRAAFLAVTAAAEYVAKEYGSALRWPRPNPGEVAAQAFYRAEHRLAQEALELGISADGGLRTTLIVVIAGKRYIDFAYIGDGGGVVIGIDGQVKSFLEPQKGGAQNVLAASLGPQMAGAPIIGRRPRATGDIIIAGTDGIFDFAEPGFEKKFLRRCFVNEGRFQKTTEDLLAECAAATDNGAPVCYDNMTLAILGDGRKPAVGTNYWLNSTGIKG